MFQEHVLRGEDITSTSFSSDGPISHCDATSVTHAFKRAENSGKGLENITAKLPGSQDGNKDLSTFLRETGVVHDREVNASVTMLEAILADGIGKNP